MSSSSSSTVKLTFKITPVNRSKVDLLKKKVDVRQKEVKNKKKKEKFKSSKKSQMREHIKVWIIFFDWGRCTKGFRNKFLTKYWFVQVQAPLWSVLAQCRWLIQTILNQQITSILLRNRKSAQMFVSNLQYSYRVGWKPDLSERFSVQTFLYSTFIQKINLEWFLPMLLKFSVMFTRISKVRTKSDLKKYSQINKKFI